MKRTYRPIMLALIVMGTIGFFTTPASAISFKISNGLTNTGVTPLADAQSAIDYYNYVGFHGTPAFGPQADTGFFWLFEDTNTGNYSLEMIFNEYEPARGKTRGGAANLSLSGGILEDLSLDLKDDPSPLDSVGLDTAGDEWSLNFSWYAMYTDGAVIGGLNAFSIDDALTIALNGSRGIDDWYFLTGDPIAPDMILLDMSSPLVITDPATPTPEPATLLLFGSGLIGMGLAGKRRRKS